VGFVGLGVLVWSLWLVRPPVQSGQVRIARVPGTSRAVVAAISAEGRYAVHGVDVGGEQSLWLREVAARSERQLVAGSSVDYWSVTFSPDSMYVYYVAWPRNRRDAGLYRVPVRGGTPQQLYEDSGRVVHLSPDGKRLAWVNSVASIGFILYVANSDGSGTKGLVIRPQSSPFSEKAVAWSADGKLITCTVRNKELDYEVLTSFRLEDGMEQPISSPKWKEIASMAWLPDGSGLLLAAREQHSSEASKEHSSAPSTQLWFLSYPGGKAHRLTNDFLDYSALSLTRDGNTVSAIARSSRSAVWVAPASQPASGKRVTGKTDNGTGLHRRVGLDL
jgi:Tol biopolymer transport system component